MKRAKSNAKKKAKPAAEEYLILRMFYLPASLDFKLRVRAEREKKNRGDLVRELLEKATKHE